MTHRIKEAVLKAVEAAYEKTYAADEQAQAKKPEFLKHVDEHVTDALRPLFT